MLVYDEHEFNDVHAAGGFGASLENLVCDGCGEKIGVGIEQHHGEKLQFVLCRRCAQHMVRTMLEDIISYDNGVRVSLLNIMYHHESPKRKMTFRELSRVSKV